MYFEHLLTSWKTGAPMAPSFQGSRVASVEAIEVIFNQAMLTVDDMVMALETIHGSFLIKDWAAHGSAVDPRRFFRIWILPHPWNTPALVIHNLQPPWFSGSMVQDRSSFESHILAHAGVCWA